MLRTVSRNRFHHLIGRKINSTNINKNVSALRSLEGCSTFTLIRFYTQPSHYIYVQRQSKEPISLSQNQKKLLNDQKFSTTEEETIFKKLLKKYDPMSLSVRDISGGCGSMYSIHIVSKKFNNLPTVRQHQMVNEFLKEDIAKWHGIQLTTKKIKNPKEQ